MPQLNWQFHAVIEPNASDRVEGICRECALCTPVVPEIATCLRDPGGWTVILHAVVLLLAIEFQTPAFRVFARVRLMRYGDLRGIMARSGLADKTVDELDDVRQEYLALREQCHGALLATLEGDHTPSASYAPLVWLDGQGYLFLSDLAGHTRNLRSCPSLGLLLIEGEDSGANAFARRRISLQCEARIVERDDVLFAAVLAEFHRRFGQVMALLESLPDFHLFRLVLRRGRYIRGFGQAYELSGDGLTQLTHVNSGK